MLLGSADFMNFISEHIYSKANADPISHAGQLRTQVKRVADAHRRYRADPQLGGKKIPVAMDEWNFWYGPYVFGELGVRYRHKDGLGVAMALHEFFRNSDIFTMANYAQTVNVLGAIKTSRTKASMETTGLALQMYRAYFGTLPIPIAEQPAGMDVAAAYTADRKAVTIAVVNVTKDAQELTLDAGGKLAFPASASTWTLASNDLEAYNDPDEGARVKIVDGPAAILPGGKVIVPPMAVVIYWFPQ
jgi:alpha-N-arabinofuranosidase